MKVRTSPVFYFGILLVIAVAGLLAAPYVVDWNGYRGDLEAYGKKLTGRAVTIDGRVSVRLFPWPRLTAEKVKIANPAGLGSPSFATAERIVLHITLAGLARGGIDVESVEIADPVIELERLATGEGNWIFSPSADLVRSDILSRVKLDQIRLSGGTVRFRDRRRGETVTLDDVNANVDSPGVQGPWRMRAAAVYDDRALDISVNTGVRIEGEPFRFGIKVAPADNSGLVVSFDGAVKDGTTEGDVRIEPAVSGDGKTDAEGQFRPLVLTAKAKGNFDRIELSALQLAPLDPRQGGALTSGTATVTLGRHIAAQVALSSAMLDLDELAGAKARDMVRQAGSLALADSVLGALPRDLSVSGRLEVTALKAGGQTLDNVSVRLDADHNALRIGEFSSGLPGRSQMLFKGVFFPGEAGAELSGSLALETNDLRALAFWAWPEGQARLGPLWTGNRGRFKMQTDVDVTPARFRLANTRYELDGQPGSAELTVARGGRGSVAITVDGSSFDLDSYAPQGLSAFSPVTGHGIGGLAALALPRSEAPDLRLRFKADEVLLNAVTAAKLSLDLESGSNGLNLRNLEIGSVGGARLGAMGLVLDSGNGADGSINLDVKAEDPTELLRLLGLIRGDALPPWARDLGPMALSGDIGVKPGDAGWQVSFGLGGTAGQLTLSGNGSLAADMAATFGARVEARSSARLLALFGFDAVDGDAGPAALQMQAAGSAVDGFMASATAQAYGARFDYQGAVNPAAPGYGLDGRLSLRSTDAAPLVRASGIPVSAVPGGALVADATIAASGSGWRLAELSGRLGTAPFKGHGALGGSGTIEMHVETGALRLADIMAATFLNWSGAGPDLETGFTSSLPFGLTGEIWIRPAALDVHRQFTARDAEIGITASDTEIRLALAGKDEQGRDAQIEVSSAGRDSSRKIAGRVYIPFDLARQLALVNGMPVAEGQGQFDVKFESTGRTPGGALSALRGSGSYAISGLKLLGLSPRAFNDALRDARDAPGITAAFDALRGGEGFGIGDVSGSVTVTDGEVAFLPFGTRTADADAMVKASAELALGEIQADITLSLKAREGLPAMTVSYGGPPMALARAEDNTELATRLGVTIMEQGIDELERLQQEQQRLAQEEEKQRLADEERLRAYYAQRDELLLRRRELKVHAEMVVAEAERLRRQIETERAANAEINKGEVKQRLREIRTYRKLARATQRPAPRKPPAAQPDTPATLPGPAAATGPVILANPPGAPVVISPPPGQSPTQ
jgi:uncharacterized protein involved in outer membrane biogenesis